jgi:hypothetical protein
MKMEKFETVNWVVPAEVTVEEHYEETVTSDECVRVMTKNHRGTDIYILGWYPKYYGSKMKIEIHLINDSGGGVYFGEFVKSPDDEGLAEALLEYAIGHSREKGDSREWQDIFNECMLGVYSIFFNKEKRK